MKKQLFLFISIILYFSILVVPVQADPTISLDKTIYAPDEEIVVTLTANYGEVHIDGAYLKIKGADGYLEPFVSDKKYGIYIHVGRASTLNAPPKHGSYEVCLFFGGDNEIDVITSIPFTVDNSVPKSTGDTTPLQQPTHSITVFVNNQLVIFDDVKPQIVNERTMVPLRALADAIGTIIDWSDEEKTVTIISGNRYAVLKIGLKSMTYGTLSRKPRAFLNSPYFLDSVYARYMI